MADERLKEKKMAQQLEIEYKTLLNLADYQKVFEYYQLQDQSFQQQTNYY